MSFPRALFAWLVAAITLTAAVLQPWQTHVSTQVVFLCAALEAPLVICLFLLLREKTRRPALSIALGVSSGMTLLLILLFTILSMLWFLILSFSPSLFFLLVAHVGLLWTSFQERQAVGPPDDSEHRELVLILAVALYVAAVPFLVMPLTSGPPRPTVESKARDVRGGNELAAGVTVREIHRCALAYAFEHKETGYPENLRVLGPAGAGCLTADQVSETAKGYAFSYFTARPDATGRVRDFMVCARPLRFEVTGNETFVLEAVARNHGQAPRQPAKPTDSLTCAAAWDSSEEAYLSGIKYCAFEYAALHPDLGYPDSLADLGAAGTACLLLPAGFSGDVIQHGCAERRCGVAYLPGLPGRDGRVEGFLIATLHPKGRYLDETAVLRGTFEDRSVLPSDPPFDELLRQPWPDLSRENLPRLRRRCAEEHDLPSCRTLARSLLVSADQWPTESSEASQAKRREAADLLDAACSDGDGSACLELPEALFRARWYLKDVAAMRLVRDDACAGDGLRKYCPLWNERLAQALDDPSPQRMRAAFERACKLGQGAGCFAAQKTLPSDNSSGDAAARALLELGCSLGDRASCVGLGGVLLRAGATHPTARRAADLFRKVCDAGDPSGCGPLGLLYRDGLGVEQDPALARHLLRRGCTLSDDASACQALTALAR